MKEILFESLAGQVQENSLESIIISFTVSLVLGLIIYLSYRFSHSGVVYSVKFNVTLVMLCVITTMIMAVIGSNIALSLGMVGALSIVRFRTAIKDPRDTCYIFWTIAIGICCGVSQYIIAFLGTATIFVFLLIFGRIKTNDRFLLVIHAPRLVDEEIERVVLSVYEGKAKMRLKNTTSKQSEYIYELSQKMLDLAKRRNLDITKELYEIDGVEGVNIVCQNEEMSI